MQTMPEEWPSMTRMLSCRHSKKVSCETLSVSNVDSLSNLQVETQSFYSDDEKDYMKDESSTGDDEANELESSSYGYCNLANDYLQHVRELEKHSGKLDNPSYGDGKAARHNCLSRFLFKASHMTAASRAEEVKRSRKHLQTYASVIRRTGGVLPHSAAPILLQIGSHSGPPNSKAPMTLRASSIIPGNAVAAKMNPLGAGEPSSPKVTCLGRVRNKQKHTGKKTSVASKEDYQVDVGCTLMLMSREKKKAATEVVESAWKKEKKASRMGSAYAMVGNRSAEKIKETDCEKALKKLTAKDSGGKGTMSARFVTKEESKRWSLRETTKHEESKISYQHQQNRQATEGSALGASSREISVDLSRFGSESQRGHEMMVANSETSSVGNDSQRFEKDDKEDSVQAPPQNALLLIRNRQAKDNPEVASSSVAAALSSEQETSLPTAIGDHVMIKIISTQFNMSTSMSHKYDRYLLPSPEVEMKKAVTIADILGHTPSLMTEGASSTVCKSERFQNKVFLQTEHSAAHRQPKPSPESSIWQRRAIGKPCALDIKKPMKTGIYQATTI